MDYKTSGVNIDAGNDAVNRIKPMVKKTYTPHVLTSLGHFASMVAVPPGYKEPIMVSCTDGVGTKLKLAIELGCFDTVGIDLVAMSVNDLICTGAKPLFFLDYIACHALLSEQVEQLIKGMVDGCLQSDCALVGGEMAEMNDLYKEGDFDLAGFACGVVEKSEIVDGRNIGPGDNVYGFASSGIHSNGFSLVRKVLTPEVCDRIGLDRKSLLNPTKIYVKDVQDLLATGKVLHGICHVTGGGIAENLARIFPPTVQAVLSKSAFTVPEIFKTIQKEGNVTEDEMFRVFNMGIGLIIITPDTLETSDTCALLGQVSQGEGHVVVI